MSGRHDHPSPNATIQNLRRPMPLGHKLALFGRNMWLKVRHRSACCGHPGEPGC